MKKLLYLFVLLCTFGALTARANYSGTLPYTVSNNQFTVDGYTFSIKDGYYQEWDHYVIFWSTGYGSKTNATTIGSGDYLLNLTQMKEYAELCYTNYTSVGFLDPTSSDGGGHKIIILAYYSTDWFATGSGVSTSDGIWGVLNIAHSSANPSADNPYYTYCHEIGHAYQYLGYAKNGGNAGFNYESGMYGWVSYYECCGNWQAALEYPALYFPQSMNLYMKTTNLAFTHAWHCYQCYPLNDYLTEKCGQTTIGDIWTINTNVAYAEPLEKYMSKTGCTAEELYRQLFFAAMRMTTWDLTRWDNYLSAQGVSRDKYMDHRMGTQACTTTATTTPQTYSDSYYPTQSTYQYVTTNSSSAIHQVAYSSAPQSSGFNCIKLNVPTGTSRTVTTKFTALAPGASLASGDKKEYWMGSMWAKSSSQSAYNTGVTAQSNSTYATYKTWRGFRLGYVAYKKSGEVRYYNYTDKVYCTGTSETSANLSFDVPDDVDSLYFIVSPALSNYLRNESSGSYDISGSSASEYVSFQQQFDQWPYRVQFYNTNIYGLTNPSTSFSGTADSGTTWTTMPDLSDGEEYGAVETTYTIKTASGSPSGAGFTVSSSLTSQGNNQYTTKATITSDNASSYITPTAVTGYSTSITVSGTTITITYTALPLNTYTISLASGSPDGAGFTTTGLTSKGSNQYTTYDEITSSNVGSYVTASDVDGYTASITVSGTTITITYTEKPAELVIQRNLNFPATTDYSGTTYTLSSSDLTAIIAQLGCTTTALKNSSNWETADSYTATAPSSGKFALYAIDPSTGDYDANTTANGWGYWMDANGDVIDYGDGCAYFMEYTETSGLFTFGEYPSALSTGNNAALKFALRYTNTSGETKTVTFIFNCTIATSTSTKYSYTIATASGSPTGAGFTTTLTKNSTFNNYESSTEITSSNVSTYVTATAVSGYTTSITVNGSEIKIKYTKSGPVDPTASFETTSTTINVGDTYTQAVTTNSDGAITYSSSKTSVATVNSSTGKVTAKGEGTATITATITATDNYNKATATYTVTVSKVTPTISFAQDAMSVPMGSTGTNALTYDGDGTVTYTSGSTSVATVNSSTGEVTPVAEGTATITASAASTTKCNAVTATYTLTVTKKAQTVTFANASLSLYAGETGTNPLTTTADGGAITYSSSNEEVATVASDGTVTAVGKGTAVITATAAATGTYSETTATYTVTVSKYDQTVTFASSEAMTLSADETGTNVATTTGDGAITYSSSNTSVATVDDKGVVTPVGKGTATITATAAATVMYNEATASYTVTVTGANLFKLESRPYAVKDSRGYYIDMSSTYSATDKYSCVEVTNNPTMFTISGSESSYVFKEYDSANYLAATTKWSTISSSSSYTWTVAAVDGYSAADRFTLARTSDGKYARTQATGSGTPIYCDNKTTNSQYFTLVPYYNVTYKYMMGTTEVSTSSEWVLKDGSYPTVTIPDGYTQYSTEVPSSGTITADGTYVITLHGTSITLEPASEDNYIVGTYNSVTLNRTFEAGFSTLCLPYTTTVSTFTGSQSGAYVAQFTGAEKADGEYTLTFTTGEDITANTPYIIYLPSALEAPVLSDVTLAAEEPITLTGSPADETGDWTMTGNYTAGKDMNGLYGIASDNSLQLGTDASTIDGFTAFLTCAASGNVKAQVLIVDGNDNATVIARIPVGKEMMAEHLYDLSGRALQRAAQRGIYIKNGRKVIK